MAGSSATKKGQAGGGRLPPKRGKIKVAILKKVIGVFTIHAKNKNNKDASSSSTALLPKPSTTSKMTGSSATKKGQAGGARLPPKRGKIKVAILKKVIGVFTTCAKEKKKKDTGSWTAHPPETYNKVCCLMESKVAATNEDNS